MRLAKFRGLNRKSFYLHLKECEFRFNYRGQKSENTLKYNIYKELTNK